MSKQRINAVVIKVSRDVRRTAETRRQRRDEGTGEKLDGETRLLRDAGKQRALAGARDGGGGQDRSSPFSFRG